MIDKSTAQFFLWYLRGYPGASALMIALLVLSGVLEGVGILSLVPLLSVASGGAGVGADSGVSAAATRILSTIGLQPTLAVLIGVIVVSMSLKAVALWLAMRQVGFIVANVARDLRLALLRGLLHAKWTFFGSQPLGRYASAITNETTAATAAYREACTLLAALIQIAIYLSVSILVSWQATLAAITIGTLLFALLRGFVGMSRAAGREQVLLNKSLASRIIETLHGMKPIKAMALEDRLLPILEADTEALNRAQQRRVVAQETPRIVQEPLAALVLGAGLYYLLVLRNLPLSSVLLLAFVFQRLVAHMNTIHLRYQLIVGGESSFWSVYEEIKAAEAATESGAGAEHSGSPLFERDICFENVSFGFGNGRILDSVSFRIPKGAFTALVGPSGAGKTTVVDLLAGIHTPSAGCVLIDGTPLPALDLSSWRRRIGYVPQELLLLNGTIRHNITLGDESIADEQVEWALRKAGAWDFVRDRTDGINAAVGDSGVKLSGGQRQRLAIARALVRTPELLILDEATAALDPATELSICQALHQLKGDMTIVAISHQAAIRDVADIIYELDGAGSLRPQPSMLTA